MAYSKNPIKENKKEKIYISGDLNTESSRRFRIDPDTNIPIIEKLINGLWQPSSFETGPNSLWVGKNVGIAGLGHHLATESSDGHLHFHTHSEYDGQITIEDASVIHADFYAAYVPVQSDESGEFIGKVFEYTHTTTSHALLEAFFIKTGNINASSSIRFQVWKGTDENGLITFDQIYPAFQFPANTEVALTFNGKLEYEDATDYFFRLSSDENFSLKTNIDKTQWTLAIAFSRIREDRLLQTKQWINGDSFDEGQYLIKDRKIYICNITGIQTGTFNDNFDKWDLINETHSMGIFTEGSIPFAGIDGKLTEDNFKLHWDSEKLLIDGQVIIENNLVSKQSDGIYFGRNKLSENNWKSSPVVNKWEAQDNIRDWEDIAISSDTKYITATVNGGKIYTSDDYGVTWVARDSDRNWKKVSMSADGQYQSTVVNNGQIYISLDYGVTWVAKDSIRNWLSIDMSSDGQYQTAGINENGIYISLDYGNNWSLITKTGSMKCVSISSTGQYQAVAAKGEGIYVSSDYGSTFSKRATVWGWIGVNMSDDGKYMTAVAVKPNGRIYCSTDYGINWNQVDDGIARDYSGIAISADGEYQTAIEENGDIYVSVNYGNFWSKQNDNNKDWSGIAMSSDATVQVAVVNAGYIYNHNTNFMFMTQSIGADDWRRVAMSSDGKYQTAVGESSLINFSSDYGKSWATFGSVTRNWTGIAMSSDGKYQTAIVLYNDIYFSSDYGVNWAGVSAGGFSWADVAMSSDGKFQVVVCGGQGSAGYIYISYNYGLIWNQKGESNNWERVVCSSDGKYITVTDSNDNLYQSTDYGEIWSRVGPSRYWKGIAMSSDGKYQTAVNTNIDKNISISSNYGISWSTKGEIGAYISVAMSSDGKHQMVTRDTYASGGGEYSLYISDNYGQTWNILYGTRFSDWADIKMSSDGKYIIAANDNGIYTYCFDSIIDGNIEIEGTINGVEIIDGEILDSALPKSDNWDNAFGWGDHSLAGYLTSEIDPIFTAWDKSTGISITESQISDLQFYLISEVDPVFTDWENGFTEGSIVFANANGLIEDNNKLFWDNNSNRFGIGLNNPARAFHLQDDNATLRIDRDTNSPAIQLHRFPNNNYTTPWKGFIFGVNAVGSDDGTFFISDFHQNVSGGGDQRLTIDTDGNIGINTEFPGTKLDVNGTITSIEGNSIEWNTAYGWGDHSVVGYLTTETDPVFTAWDKSTGISITESQISDLNHFNEAAGNLSGITQNRVSFGNASGGLTDSPNLTYSDSALRISNGGIYLDRPGADSFLVLKRSGTQVGQIRGADGSIDITDSGGSSVYFSVDTISGITSMNGVDTPEIFNTSGLFKIQPDAQGDVEVFGDTDVDNVDNGKILKIWRKAAEGNDYVRFYVSSNRTAYIHASNNLTLQAQQPFTINSVTDDIIFKVGDNAGTKKVYFKDSDGNVVTSIDSNGQLIIDANMGGILKIVRGSNNTIKTFMDSTYTDLRFEGGKDYNRIGTWIPNSFQIVTDSVNRITVDSVGKVGIGTVPSTELDVAGSNPILRLGSTKNGEWTIGEKLSGLEFYGNDGSTPGPGVKAEIDVLSRTTYGNNFDMTFNIADTTGVLTELMRIFQNGNIGVGIPTPDSLLHLYNGNIRLESDSSDISLLFTDNDDDNTLGLLFDKSEEKLSIVGGMNSDRTPSFLDNIMTFTRSFRVGIKQSNPTCELDVNGNTRLDGNVEITGNMDPLTFESINGIKLDLYGGNYAIGVESSELRISSNSKITFRTDGYGGNVDVAISDNGYLGIGTDDPHDDFHIKTSSPSFVLEDTDSSSDEKVWELIAASGQLKWLVRSDLYSAGYTWLQVDRGGAGVNSVCFPASPNVKVGIGTTTPEISAALEIKSTQGALLLPRMTTSQRNNLTAINGMMVYDTDQNAFRVYENGSWRSI